MLLCWIIFKNLVAVLPDILCKQIMYNQCFFNAMEKYLPQKLLKIIRNPAVCPNIQTGDF